MTFLTLTSPLFPSAITVNQAHATIRSPLWSPLNCSLASTLILHLTRVLYLKHRLYHVASLLINLQSLPLINRREIRTLPWTTSTCKICPLLVSPAHLLPLPPLTSTDLHSVPKRQQIPAPPPFLSPDVSVASPFYFFKTVFYKIYLCIYLAASGLSCDMRDRAGSFAEVGRLLSSCGAWVLQQAPWHVGS